MELLEKYIKIGEELKDTFNATHNYNTKSCNDIEKLSSWLSEIIMFLPKKTTIDKNDVMFKKFESAYDDIFNLKPEQFKVLLGTLKTIKNNYDECKSENDVFF